MPSNMILIAETGSDTPKELARELGIILVPMHVSMGDETLDDGTSVPRSNYVDFTYSYLFRSFIKSS